MIASLFRLSALLPRAVPGAILVALCAGLSGCADMSDSMTSAFADPAKYNLYDCKQLETERKSLAAKLTELQGLIDKAQGGFAGPAVAEIAYRNEYISVRGQAKNAEEAWVVNKCRETAPTGAKAAAPPAPPAADRSAHPPMRSGSAVY